VVISGGDVSGIDINVVAPAAGQPVNAEELGVANIGEQVTASSAGATVRPGENKKVLIFGPGLDGSVQITIGGPGDITVSNIRSARSGNNDPGVSFDIAVSSGAALGARSVILRAPNDDVTSFTGGLEVRQ
jgi:hypothetical protein